MNRFILQLSLIFGLNSGFAQVPMDSNTSFPIASQKVYGFIGNDILGQKGVEFFNTLAKQSQPYGFLLSLDSGVPEVAKQLKYVALLNEAHLANQTLSLMLIALKDNNQLLEKILHIGGAMNG